MRFLDAHCDTIGPIWEGKADFAAANAAQAVTEEVSAAHAAASSPTDHPLHVTLPGLRVGHIGAQVFASWTWSGAHKGREFEVGMAKVEAVRRLCADFPQDLVLALSAAELAEAFAADGAQLPRVAVLPSLEGADPLLADVDNLFAFHDAGVRLLTLAWGDNPFCGSTYGDGTGLTKKGADLVAACESLGVMVDVSHLSDQAFKDVCDVAERPFVASHSDCRSLCPHPRNLTDEMIRALALRGGVVGISLAPEFLSAGYYEAERAATGNWYAAVSSGQRTFEQVTAGIADAMAAVPRPPLSLIVDHVRWAINVGGEDCVGLGGDLDGVDRLPAGFAGVQDYPRIEDLLRQSGLPERQIEKVCYGNFLRVLEEVLG
jgi:membrane dipeptidase